jgi:hypothetical protein
MHCPHESCDVDCSLQPRPSQPPPLLPLHRRAVAPPPPHQSTSSGVSESVQRSSDAHHPTVQCCANVGSKSELSSDFSPEDFSAMAKICQKCNGHVCEKVYVLDDFWIFFGQKDRYIPPSLHCWERMQDIGLIWRDPASGEVWRSQSVLCNACALQVYR